MPSRAPLALAVALALAPTPPAGGSGDRNAPRLALEAPPSLAAAARRLEQIDPGRLAAVARLVGLEAAGPAVRIVLAPEDSDVAAETPPWVPAFASDDVVVILPNRTLSYPYTTLEEVLQHEIAHVLVARASGHRPVPRWFNEGVAMLAEQAWSLGERTRFAYELASGRVVSPREIDALFHGSAGDRARAYNLSNAWMHDLVGAHGPDFPARVLRAMRTGREFEAAFLDVAGTTVGESSTAFWRRHRLWLVWLPWLTSPQTLYTLTTVLALLAFWRARALRAARRRAQEAEDPVEHDSP